MPRPRQGYKEYEIYSFVDNKDNTCKHACILTHTHTHTHARTHTYTHTHKHTLKTKNLNTAGLYMSGEGKDAVKI